MNDIEQRLRDSLRVRSTDVEPTPALWREVDRRISRRRRLRVAGWSLVGAAALVVAVLALPGLFGTGVTVPDIEPITPPAPSDEGDEDAADDVVPDDAAPDDPEDPAPTEPDEGQDAVGIGDDTLLIADGNELRLLGPAGDQPLIRLAEEGESTVAGVAVRPGSTPDDLTAAVLTQAEGMWDLRELRLVDGEASLEVFDERYRPGLGGGAGDGLSVRGPVWSPDGTSLAWLESGTGGVFLRTIGWSDGPGTGDDATDNAQWEVGGVLPAGSVPNDWVVAGDDGTAIRVTMSDSTEGWYLIRLDRQADGAWALAGEEVVAVDADEPGTVAAVAGSLADPDGLTPQWLVRTTFDGVELLDQVAGPGAPVELPAGLLPGTGLADLWARPLGDGVVVGSASTRSAWVVTGPDEQTRLEGDVTYADVIR